MHHHQDYSVPMSLTARVHNTVIAIQKHNQDKEG